MVVVVGEGGGDNDGQRYLTTVKMRENGNFEKQFNAFFPHVPRITGPRN